MAGVDWLAIGVAALSVAAVGLALWLGVHREQPRPKSPPRGSRRGKRNKAYIERRKAVVG